MGDMKEDMNRLYRLREGLARVQTGSFFLHEAFDPIRNGFLWIQTDELRGDSSFFVDQIGRWDRIDVVV